ncbi:MAG: hypothetical protein AAFY34_06485 [Pseudomonadota bacterium]
MMDFNFSNAFMHFARANAPQGFFWKYCLSYIGVSLLIGLGSSFITPDPTDLSPVLFVTLAGFYLISFIILAIFEASWQRRYMRGGGFKLALGRDEVNIFLLYLLWILFIVVMYFLMFAMTFAAGAIAGVGGSALAGVITVLAVIGACCLWIFWAVRLSAASALTIRDQRVRFFASWRVTKGRFWTLFGAQLVMSIALIALLILIFGMMGALSFIDLTDTSDPAAFSLLGILSNADGVIGIVLISLGLIGSYIATSWWLVVWGGPAALAARTDPERAHMDDPASAFQ